MKDQASKFLSLVLAALIYGLVKADKDSPGRRQNTRELILYTSESGQRCKMSSTSLTFNHALLLRQSLNIKMMVGYLQAYDCHGNCDQTTLTQSLW